MSSHVAGALSRQRLLGATEYGHREVLVKGYVHEVVIACGSEVIARHPSSYEREDMVFDPLHYLALLEQKTRRWIRRRRWKAGSCRSVSATAAAAGSAAEQGRPARVCAGVAPAGDLPSA